MKKAEKLNFFCYFLFAHFEYFSLVSVYLTSPAKRERERKRRESGKKETWNEGESVTALFSFCFLFFLTNLSPRKRATFVSD